MRLKFRAFSNGEWWYSDDEAYLLKEYDGELFLVEDTQFYLSDSPRYTKIGKAVQFTGLKDKNGKDIFEGDIVVTLWGDRCEGVVKYDDSCAQFCFKANHLGRSFSYDFVTTQSDEYEIIGNIHEDKAKEAGK